MRMHFKRPRFIPAIILRLALVIGRGLGIQVGALAQRVLRLLALVAEIHRDLAAAEVIGSVVEVDLVAALLLLGHVRPLARFQVRRQLLLGRVLGAVVVALRVAFVALYCFGCGV